MPKLKFIRSIKSKIDTIPVIDGQLIFATDSYGLYLDLGSERKEFKQIISLTSDEREELLTPVTSFYFETDTGHLFYYNGTWTDISVDPNSLVITFNESEDLLEISSGETLSSAFGKIKTAINRLINHLKDVGNPHKVTKNQIGLGKVENKSSTEILDEIDASTVSAALGYEPASTESVDELWQQIGTGSSSTVKGESINIRDSANAPLLGLKMFGKAEQITGTGAQLAYITQDIIWRAEDTGLQATVLSDGSVIISGTPLYEYAVILKEEVTSGIEPGDYYVSGGEYGTGKMAFQVTISKGGQQYYYANKPFTIDGTETYVDFSIVSCGDKNPINNYRIYPMLNKGASPLPLEPYTYGNPVPSPDYPSSILSPGNYGKVQLQVSTPDGSSVQYLNIDFSSGLFGLPVDSGGNYIDKDGQSWVSDIVDFSTGKALQCIPQLNLVDYVEKAYDITESITGSDGSTSVYALELSGSVDAEPSTAKFIKYGMCTHFIYKLYESGLPEPGTCIVYSPANDSRWYFCMAFETGRFDGVASFQSWIRAKKPAALVYSVDIPYYQVFNIPEETTSQYHQLHTYDSSTIITSNAVNPSLYMEVKYQKRASQGNPINDTIASAIKSYFSAYEDLFVFGFIEHLDVSEPENRIEYIGLNKNYSPMVGNLTEHTMDYGSWGSFPSIVQNKPYMVLPTGEADYELNEYAYTLKKSGEPSDIDNVDYAGGAFSKFIRIYVKRWIEGNERHVQFSYIPLEGYTACGFIDEDGSEMDYVWLPMFYGSTVNGAMRSLSGLQPDSNQSVDEQKLYIDAFSDRSAFLGGPIIETIRDMLYMLAKTTDISSVFGCGNVNGMDQETWTYNVLPNAGVGGGQWYGSEDCQSLNKIFHSIVLGTHQCYQRDPYLLLVNGEYQVSTNYTYDVTGESYIHTGIYPELPSESQWVMANGCSVVDGWGCLPTEPYGANPLTAYGLMLPAEPSGTNVALRFGDWDGGSEPGIAAIDLNTLGTAQGQNLSASVLLRAPK